ncbi:uracil-DNA glycosylase-like protein, partial [Kalaharituber pfeilii]
ICVFIGTNPGLLTAYTAHTYASPTNCFWKLLHESGLTPTPDGRPLHPSQDRQLPRRYLLGNTNIVERATRSQEQLSREELAAGAGRTVERVARWRPEAVCVVGRGVWEGFVGWVRREGKEGRNGGVKGRVQGGKGFTWGWQGGEGEGEVRIIGDGAVAEEMDGWKGARVYVVPSTSGLVTMGYARKLELWRPLGEWVSRRRTERGFVCE